MAASMRLIENSTSHFIVCDFGARFDSEAKIYTVIASQYISWSQLRSEIALGKEDYKAEEIVN